MSIFAPEILQKAAKNSLCCESIIFSRNSATSQSCVGHICLSFLQRAKPSIRILVIHIPHPIHSSLFVSSCFSRRAAFETRPNWAQHAQYVWPEVRPLLKRWRSQNDRNICIDPQPNPRRNIPLSQYFTLLYCLHKFVKPVAR